MYGVAWLLNQAGSAWNSLPGLTVGSLVAGFDKSTLMALDTSGHPYHWNVYAPSITGTTSGSWNGCPGPGNIYHIGTTHTANLTLQVGSSYIGVPGTDTESPTTNMHAVSWAAGGICDLLFGNPNDPECHPTATGAVVCNQTGTNLGSPAAPELDCLLNIPPPRLVGWAPGTAVNVYISSYWSTSQQDLICVGIASVASHK